MRLFLIGLTLAVISCSAPPARAQAPASGGEGPAQLPLTGSGGCTATFTSDDSGTFPKTFTLDRQTGALAVDLSGVSAGATVFRAELMLNAQYERSDRPAAPTEVFVEGSPDKPLKFVAPRFASLDVLEPVRAAVKAGTPLRLVVKHTCAGVARLEVSFLGGKPKVDIPVVTGLKVTHRAGQSLLVFVEPKLEDLPELKTLGQFKAFRDGFIKKHPGLSLRVWRGPERITPKTIARAELVGEFGFLSASNHAFYNDRDGLGKDPEALRYSVTDGGEPVPRGTGIYAHNPTKAGKAFYAVTVCVNGEEDFSRLGDGNATAEAVEETVGLGVPILQRTVVSPTKECSRKLYYTRWESWPNASTPSVPIDYVVQFPEKQVEPAPVLLALHAWGGSLDGGYGWWYQADRGTVLIASNQEPYDWWTGYNECNSASRFVLTTPWPTPGLPGLTNCKTYGDGRVYPFTATRLLSFLDWAATQWKLDLKRVYTCGHSMGGGGAPTLAIRYGDRIAACFGSVGIHIPAEAGKQFLGSYVNNYGPRDAAVTMSDGKTSPWDYFNDDWYLRQYPKAETGLILASNGKNDGAIPWGQAYKFARALQETRRPHIYNWCMGGHSASWTAAAYGRLDQDVRTDQTLPAFSNCTLDDDIGTGKPLMSQEEAGKEWSKQEDEIKSGKRKSNEFFNTDGVPVGGYNLHLRWQTDDVVDTVNAWEMTVILKDSAPKPECKVDLTPRRLQQFKTPKGARFAYTVTDVKQNKELAKGEATADELDLLTLKQIPLVKGKNRVKIVPARK